MIAPDTEAPWITACGAFRDDRTDLQEVAAWCKDNLSDGYKLAVIGDGEPRIIGCFRDDRDASLFRLWWS